MADHTFLSPFRSMIASDCPNWMVRDQLQKHLEALKTLADDVEGRDAAITETEALLNELPNEDN